MKPQKLVWVLCLALLLGGISPLSAVATEVDVSEVSTSIDDHLIVHFDFETVDKNGRVVDISPVGTKKETLYLGTTKDSDGNALSYLSGGVAHIDASGNNYLSCGDLGDDVRACTEMTVFTVVKATGTPTGSFATVMDLNNVLRPYITTAGVFARAAGNSFDVTSGGYKVAMNEFIWMAFSLKWDPTSQILTAKTYLSTDGGRTYTEKSTTQNSITQLFSNCEKLYLGKVFSGSGFSKSGILSFDFDDFRIYNKALSRGEVESIQVEKTPANIHTQDRVKDGSYDLRFCATVDSLDYEEVGFEIVAKNQNGEVLKTFRHSSKSVYQSVLALGSPVTAESLGGKYLIAYAILDIPDHLGTVIFYVRSYAVRNGITYYGSESSVEYNGSTFVEA